MFLPKILFGSAVASDVAQVLTPKLEGGGAGDELSLYSAHPSIHEVLCLTPGTAKTRNMLRLPAIPETC